jgi:hypothetical protein
MGGHHIFVLILALLVLVSVPIVEAIDYQPVEVSIEPLSIKTDLEIPARFLIKIRNRQNFVEELKISVEGPHIHWVTNPIILLLAPKNSTKEVMLTFYPVAYRGNFDFDVTTYSYKTSMVHDTRSINLYIPPPIVAENFTVAREGALVTATIDIETLKKESLNLITTLFDIDGGPIDASQDSYEIQGKSVLTHTLALPNNPIAGDYNVKYSINNNLTGEQFFTVEPIHKVERTEKLVANAMFGVVTVTYRNIGNIAEMNYATQEVLPTITITGFITNPDSCQDGLVDKTCTYIISELQPGATAQISYRVEYWPYYIQIAAAAIITFIILGFSFLRAAKPSLGKRSIKKSTNVHSVILEVKNPFLHHLKDVVIRDWVSPLARVMHHEIGGLKPVLKKSGAGTELIWKIGEIKPKEVRYLNYKIKTLVEGNLKMPRAYIRFRTPKGIRMRIYSKFLHLN